MSRTDKDVPAWVFTKYYEPSHTVDCEFYQGWNTNQFRPKRACNLPDEPTLVHPSTRNPRWRPNTERSCTWEPCISYYSYDTDNDLRPRWWTTVPKWYLDHVYHNKLRRDTRDSCRKALQEYNACGDTDTEPFPEQARHSARWMWD